MPQGSVSFRIVRVPPVHGLGSAPVLGSTWRILPTWVLVFGIVLSLNVPKSVSGQLKLFPPSERVNGWNMTSNSFSVSLRFLALAAGAPRAAASAMVAASVARMVLVWVYMFPLSGGAGCGGLKQCGGRRWRPPRCCVLLVCLCLY